MRTCVCVRVHLELLTSTHRNVIVKLTLNLIVCFCCCCCCWLLLTSKRRRKQNFEPKAKVRIRKKQSKSRIKRGAPLALAASGSIDSLGGNIRPLSNCATTITNHHHQQQRSPPIPVPVPAVPLTTNVISTCARREQKCVGKKAKTKTSTTQLAQLHRKLIEQEEEDAGRPLRQRPRYPVSSFLLRRANEPLWMVTINSLSSLARIA